MSEVKENLITTDKNLGVMKKKITVLEKELAACHAKIVELNLVISNLNKILLVRSLYKHSEDVGIPITDEDFVWRTGNGASYG